MYTIETFLWLIMKTIDNETAEKISLKLGRFVVLMQLLIFIFFLGLILKGDLNASKRDGSYASKPALM